MTTFKTIFTSIATAGKIKTFPLALASNKHSRSCISAISDASKSFALKYEDENLADDTKLHLSKICKDIQYVFSLQNFYW